MSDLFQNATNSIRIGLEDFKSNDEWRTISALRNFYAGVLLLGKNCLISSVPIANPKSVLSTRFEPIPDGNGDIEIQPIGQRTVDLHELRGRFKQFGLPWPDGDIDSLQKIRNEFEHSYSSIRSEAIRQVIADCFPLVEGFFRILRKDPADALQDAWQIMLEENAFFVSRKRECDESFSKLPWGKSLQRTSRMSCDKCGSSLIQQEDVTNDDPTSISGRCLSCGEMYSPENTIRIIVKAEHGWDDYVSFKDGGDRVVFTCQECGEDTYAFDEDINMCYYCGTTITGKCGLCEEFLTILNRSTNNGDFCDYCEHKIYKIMRE